MKKREMRIALIVLFLLTIALTAVLFLKVFFVPSEPITISHKSGIYHEAIELSIKSNRPATILYTTNGETPSIQNENTKVYTEPILLPVGEDTATYSYKFICVYGDETISDVYTRDYIMDGVSDRFTTTYVVSITGNEEQLYGYEQGLFVRGRQFDEYMSANPDVDTLGTVIPANYFSDTEIPVHAAIYTKDGATVLSQDCGLKIYGNITRAKNQKSFRLIARYDYADVNEFSYAFLPNLVSDKTNTVIDEFQRLSFHNAGNDHGYGFVRTELIGELARRAGFQDVLVSESVTVYINGKYQGVYWLENTFDDRYFKEKYGDYNGEMVVCEGTLDTMDLENAETEYEEAYTRDYNTFTNWLKEADLQDDANWQRVCDTMDIYNFAQYMAIEYYIGNIDWPHNNVKVYRYACEPNGVYTEGTALDGKYRFILYDTDYGMGLKFQGWFGEDETAQRLNNLSESNVDCRIFQNMLNREEFRNLFVSAVLCLMNESFSPDEVTEVLNEFNEKRMAELCYMVEDTDLLKDSLWESDDNNMDNVRQEWNEIIRFAENRHLTILSELNEKWACGEMLDVSISLPDEGSVMIGGTDVGRAYDGYWLENSPMDISCATPPGVTVTGYNVNSGFIEGETIRLIPGEYKQASGKVIIEPVLTYEPVTSLHIAAYDIDGTEDYIVLENNGRTDLLLSDYYVSDSEKDVSRGRLPELVLKPGGQFVVYGGKYSGNMEENGVRVSFSWNEEEAVYLIHQSMEIIDTATR